MTIARNWIVPPGIEGMYHCIVRCVWRAVLFALFLLTGHSLLAAGEAAAKPPEDLILNETAYWRYYIVPGQDRFSAQAMKAESAQVLSPEVLRRLEAQTKKRCKNIDWKTVDWMTEARYMIPRTQKGSWTNGQSDGPLQYDMDFDIPPPPPSWMNSEFDDSVWPRQRLPFLMGSSPTLVYEFASPSTFGWQRACYRTRFVVDDPGAVKKLALKLVYRGGVRVFINGTELARRNLPDGELSDTACAEDYPLAAYAAEPDEAPEKDRPDLAKRVVGELTGGFLDGTDLKKPTEFRGAGINGGRGGLGGSTNRKGWERLNALRNRVLTPEPLPIPAHLLKKGSNCLVIEVRASRLHPVAALVGAERIWHHTGIVEVRLCGDRQAVQVSLQRPAGIQAWVEDPCKRVLSREFLEAGAQSGTARIVGARNGTYGAQIVVGTDRELKGFKASCGELKTASGAVIPASHLRVQYLVPHLLPELPGLGMGRNIDASWRKYSLSEAVDLAFMRHADDTGKPSAVSAKERCEKAAKLSFFDHISPSPPQLVPADTCHPVWLSVQVPENAVPGTYQGAVRIEAEGLAPLFVPVTTEVLGWRVPDPHDFTVFMAFEQSPYGVARQYGVPLWSDKHFELMAASFRELARAGNKWLFVPVILDTEFGNWKEFRDPPLIQWIRKKDGSLAFDYVALDRYLDLALKHWGALPVISFVIMPAEGGHGGRAKCLPAQVRILDEASGQTTNVELLPDNSQYEALWGGFSMALYQHMKDKGLEKSMHWGYLWDTIADPALMTLLEKYVPEVKWTAGAHASYEDNPRVRASSAIHNIQDVNKMGWQRQRILLHSPRDSGGLITAQGSSLPFSYRLAVDRALVSGLNGIGRWGADYWKNVYGVQQGGYYPPGMGCVQVLWPGLVGAESSVRFEAALEGIQETEARIFIEQARERGWLDAALKTRATQALSDLTRSTLFITTCVDMQQTVESVSDWRGYSRRVYAMAAEVAAALQLDVRKNTIELVVPARGKLRTQFILRNWTPKEKTWRLKSETPWLTPEKPEGRIPTGQQEIGVLLDATGLEPGKTAMGSVSVTDVETGIARAIEIKAIVSPLFEFRGEQNLYANIVAGEEKQVVYMLRNLAGVETTYKIDGGAAWVRAEPDAVKLLPGAQVTVCLCLKPAVVPPAKLEATTVVSDTTGTCRREIKISANVLPPYIVPAALPAGEAVNLEAVSKDLLQSHQVALLDPWPEEPSVKWVQDQAKTRGPIFRDVFAKWEKQPNPIMGKDKKTYDGGLWVHPYHETVYKLEGAGFTAFSAVVGISLDMAGRVIRKDIGHCFEILVDGKLRACSGILKATDEPRLLVVQDLAGAKELKLVTRMEVPFSAGRLLLWAEPKFYRVK